MRLCQFALALVALLSSAANGAIIFDWSPATTGGRVTSNNWSNQFSGQSFGESVRFSQDFTVNEIDIYANAAYGEVGSRVIVSIWSNLDHQEPGALEARFSTTITAADMDGAVDTVALVGTSQRRFHADFDDFLMRADATYWIGMTGDGLELTQTAMLFVDGGDRRMAQFSNGNFSFMTAYQQVGDMAFRLHGSATTDAGSAPEPGTLALLGLALAGLATLRSRKR